MIAGIFIGCLTYKPQWGILIPVALLAAKEWRAFAGAAATTALLVGASIAVFGTGPWEAFPRELLAQAGINLSVDPDILNLPFDQGPTGNITRQFSAWFARSTAVLLWLGSPRAWQH